MSRSIVLPLVASAVLIAAGMCCCTLCADFGEWEVILPTVPTVPTVIPSPEPTAHVIRDLPTDTALETQALLETTIVPVRDLHDLAIRLSGLDPDTPRQITSECAPDCSVGTRRLFHVSNVDTDERFDIHAILEYKTEHVYMWVEEGASFDRDALEAAADLFEEHTYPTTRSFFGSEWSPGVDTDPHLSILHARGLGSSVAGYYSSSDEFVVEARSDSNEMEMFYINLDTVRINSDFYNGVLAHEFQHMIHWHQDRNEETWLNEGFSELAAYLNGFDVGGFEYSFADEPDLQLNAWSEWDSGTTESHYGAAYLFAAYFLDRFGSEATQALVAHPENSFASVNGVLDAWDDSLAHEDLFADWVVANLLDDPSLADGQYGYEEIDPTSFDSAASYGESRYPTSESGTVHQYGTDYVEMNGSRPLTVHFTGSTQVGLVDTTAHSGQYAWWSNRGDDSDMWLTRVFDLSEVSEATLEFWVWYDIEKDWDYAYVEASLDGGQTWDILTTPSGTDSNPNGSSYGWAYTGTSGWIHEQVDLDAYAGQMVWVRFEYITDDGINRPGLLLDDVAVPEIGYFSDFEEDDGGWEPAGFIRHANVLRQDWLVQLILFGPETTVQRLALSDEQVGEWTVPLDSADRAVLAISAIAPVTTETASYRYEIGEQ